jgi:leucyl aminopeptidase
MIHRRPDELAGLLAAAQDIDIVVGLFAADDGVRGGRGAAVLAEALGVDVAELAGADPDFDGRPTARSVAVLGRVRIVMVGLGPRAESLHALFDAALATGSRRAFVSTLALEARGALGAVAQGHALGRWRYRRGPDTPLPPIEIVDDTPADAAPVLARAAVIAHATNWVRQLVETPANLLRPSEFADAVIDFAGELAPGSVTVEVWDPAMLHARGFGATLAVGAGSAHPPLVVAVRIAGAGPTTALAGKGITFDSGGINLKRDAGELGWMKADMAGAASVAAAVIAAAALGRRSPVTALLPMAENMPGPAAVRPGDVVTHPGGRTTEVLDTDSEGRLVLADALGWLAAQRPAQLIDVGTLTDSGGVGPGFWGCWATSSELAAAVVDAGSRAFDRGWRLPLPPAGISTLPSRVADIANVAPGTPDTGQQAAAYLSTFVGDVPWVHIDNGSSAWLERDAPPWPAGPTGTPVRALIEFLHPASELTSGC